MLRRGLMATLETLNLNNFALRSLPIDKETQNVIRQVEAACFTLVEPTPVENPSLVSYSLDALSLLDLPQSEINRAEFVQYMSGNKLLRGSQTAAHCYCGHQQGYFSGQLGDGAAMYLGEILNSKDERWEIQLKGTGLTPFSNHRDGRKVLRSSIREFLCSEAMYHLGIPTTRAGCCVTSDTIVDRDKDYTGTVTKERASLVLRIAPTFLRFGSFEIFKETDPLTGYQGPSAGRVDILHQLLGYTIKNFYPQVSNKDNQNPEEDYLAFYKELTLLTARLVADWQCVGFCHGVLNSDNMSIIGFTIDYGPFGFLDYYDPNYLSQASDARRRNSFKNQPDLCKWNLLKLAEAIQDALPLQKSRAALEDLFDCEFQKCFMAKMKLKLGLLKKDLPSDKNLVTTLLDTMEKTGADFTNTFRCLSIVTPTNCSSTESDEDVIEYLVSQCISLQGMITAYSAVVEWSQMMEMSRDVWKSSPNVIAQIEMEAGKHQLQDEIRRKKVEQLRRSTQEEKEKNDRVLWTEWIRKYKIRLNQECDQLNAEEVNQERVKTMKSNNPSFVLRNYIAQRAIQAAEKGDYSVVQNILKRLEKPYSEDVEDKEASFYQTASTTKKTTIFNVSDINEPYLDKPPDNELNMRLT
ncbi:hypothetical protein ACROYT_G024432 [Oculina patagonica]